jgi:O-antigen/teichoic acid export membrane protein
MSLARKATAGAAWTIGVGLLSRSMGLIGTLILTRFLAPEVMGEVVTATVIAFMANWATQLGFNQYVLVRGDQGPEPIFHVTVLSLSIAVFAFGAVAFAGPLLGPVLNSPNLHLFLPGMTLAVFIRRIGAVPDKLLLRQMRFRTVAVAAALGEVTYTLVAMYLVVTTSLGGSAIVIGNVVQACVITGITIAACGTRSWLTPVRLRWARIKEVFAFGLPLGVEVFLYESARYGDKLVYTRTFGAGITGEYNLAYNLADLPAVYVGEQVSNVLLPTLLNVNVERRKGVLVRAIGLLALVTFPMAAGLAVIAHTLVDVLLPDHWHGVAPFLVVLAAVSVFRPINGLISQYLISAERNTRLMAIEFLRVGVLFGGLLLLGLIGPTVAALAVGLGAFAQMCGLLHAVHGDGSFLKGVLAALRAPVLACLVMVMVVLTIRALVGPAQGVREVMLLAAELIGGACTYVAVMFAFGRAAALEVLALVRGVLQPRTA